MDKESEGVHKYQMKIPFPFPMDVSFEDIGQETFLWLGGVCAAIWDILRERNN